MHNGFTEHEIASQATAWQATLTELKQKEQSIKALWKTNHYQHVIFTGCGSTHYLANTAAQYFQEKTGVLARCAPASELLVHPENVYVKDVPTLLVAISRSGSTTETVQAARNFRDTVGNHVLNVSCYNDKPLNDHATLTLAVTEAQEQSVAQTRSFSSMLLLIEGFTQIVAGNPSWSDFMPDTSAGFVQQAQKFASSYVTSEAFDQYFYLGSGSRYGLACEAMLKMKEMSLSHAEAYHPLEFRHGPMSMVDEKTVIVGLLGEDGHDAETAVLKDMEALGATIITIGHHTAADFSFADRKSASLVYFMPALQWLAYLRAVDKKLDPDHPRHLNQVVELSAVVSK